MNKQFQEIFQIVQNINDLITEQFSEEDLDLIPYLNLTTDGFSFIVTLLDQTIWSSENDERKFIDDQNDFESLELFLKSQSMKLITTLNKIKL